MFLPTSQADRDKAAQEEKHRKIACQQIERWAVAAIPEAIRSTVQIHVQEVVCGDPECSPIDTAVGLFFDSGGRGMMGLPMEAKNVTREILLEGFPTHGVLLKWHKGEQTAWPPSDQANESLNNNNTSHEEPPSDQPLRFSVGQRVECRVGTDPVTGWAPGLIVQCWYREPTWPRGSWAPYKIQLDDNKMIFAPADVNDIIRFHKDNTT